MLAIIPAAVLAVVLASYKVTSVEGANCCINSTSSESFEEPCTCLRGDATVISGEGTGDLSRLYHWVLDDPNVDLINRKQRGMLTFEVQPCSGSAHLFLKSASPSSWPYLPTYNSTLDLDVNSITLDARYAEHVALVNATPGSTYQMTMYTSLSPKPVAPPDGGSALVTSVNAGGDGVVVAFTAGATAGGGAAEYQLVYAPMPRWDGGGGSGGGGSGNETAAAAAAVPAGCAFSPNDTLADAGRNNPNCIFWTPCGAQAAATYSSDWVTVAAGQRSTLEARNLDSGTVYMLNVVMRAPVSGRRAVAGAAQAQAVYTATALNFTKQTYEDCVVDPNCKSQAHSDEVIKLVVGCLTIIFATLLITFKCVHLDLKRRMRAAAQRSAGFGASRSKAGAPKRRMVTPMANVVTAGSKPSSRSVSPEASPRPLPNRDESRADQYGTASPSPTSEQAAAAPPRGRGDAQESVPPPGLGRMSSAHRSKRISPAADDEEAAAAAAARQTAAANAWGDARGAPVDVSDDETDRDDASDRTPERANEGSDYGSSGARTPQSFSSPQKGYGSPRPSVKQARPSFQPPYKPSPLMMQQGSNVGKRPSVYGNASPASSPQGMQPRGSIQGMQPRTSDGDSAFGGPSAAAPMQRRGSVLGGGGSSQPNSAPTSPRSSVVAARSGGGGDDAAQVGGGGGSGAPASPRATSYQRGPSRLTEDGGGGGGAGSPAAAAVPRRISSYQRGGGGGGDGGASPAASPRATTYQRGASTRLGDNAGDGGGNSGGGGASPAGSPRASAYQRGMSRADGGIGGGGGGRYQRGASRAAAAGENGGQSSPSSPRGGGGGAGNGYMGAGSESWGGL